MDFKDIAGRLKQQREPSPSPTASLIDPAEVFRIRARMIGVLLRDARISAGRTVDDCAARAGIDASQIEAWEVGDDVPSLPQLEVLAYYLDVPVSHFWGKTTLEAHETDPSHHQHEYIALRNRLIGALLRQAREERGFSLPALAAETDLPADLIERYELGDPPVPLHELTVLASAVRKNLSYFLEARSQIGDFLAMREAWKTFVEMPEEMRRFAANPLNAGYIEIAMMLSQMPADRLRKVGESMLNITL